MTRTLPIDVPKEALHDFCRRHHIHKLAFFGSVIREDFGRESDIDVLAEFEPEHVPGLIRLAGLELELSNILGRKVDLNTPGFFNPELRERILAEAVVEYDET